MPRHVALLRGINVGGNNLIPMARLRACCEDLGLEDVTTYIQSGNVVFSARPSPRLAATIEEALATAFGYAARIVLVSAAELEQIVAEAPAGFGSEPEKYRYDVLFVRWPLTTAAVLPQVPVRDGVDEVTAGTHAVYARRLVARAAGSRLSRLAGTKVYADLTIRNWNTTTRLLALAGR